MKLFYCLALVFIFSCNPDPVSNNQNNGILNAVEMISPSLGVSWSMRFNYDSKNRVIMINESNTETGYPVHTSSWIFSYEGNKILPREGVNTVVLGSGSYVYHHYYSQPSSNEADPVNDSMVTSGGPNRIYTEVTRYTDFRISGQPVYKGYTVSYEIQNSVTSLMDSSSIELITYNAMGSTGFSRSFYDPSLNSNQHDRRFFIWHIRAPSYSFNSPGLALNPLNELNIAPLFYFQSISNLGRDDILNTLFLNPIQQTDLGYSNINWPQSNFASDIHHKYGIDTIRGVSRPVYDTVVRNATENGISIASYGPMFVKYIYQ